MNNVSSLLRTLQVAIGGLFFGVPGFMTVIAGLAVQMGSWQHRMTCPY